MTAASTSALTPARCWMAPDTPSARYSFGATDCADYLVTKGVPFRDAYAVSGQLVRLCVERGETLDTLPLEEYRKVHPAFDEDVYPFIDLTNCVSKRKVYGGPAPEAVQAQIENARKALD